jgi:hypothetical protein
MSRLYQSTGLRKAFEQIFAGAVFLATVGLVIGGTVAMCIPSVTLVA